MVAATPRSGGGSSSDPGGFARIWRGISGISSGWLGKLPKRKEPFEKTREMGSPPKKEGHIAIGSDYVGCEF